MSQDLQALGVHQSGCQFKPMNRGANRCSPQFASSGRAGRPSRQLVWHGKGSKAAARINSLDDRLMAREGYESSTLWWNLCRVGGYIRNNVSTLVNYGARYRRGLPISSSIAESAVNLVVSHRMAKKQQMRWTDEGAHCLAQVRVAALNGELSPARLAALAKRSSARTRHACSVA